MDLSDELLEEPLYLNGVTIRRWSDLARVPRPRDPSPEDRDRRLTPERDRVPRVP
ncbi:MAG: hypothetical protein AVDCRST_MAG57-1855 [uncultured Blastococcus sp.]|uniref:Uncharacterized protein n=1 Tax=uncultured Blastococcus sp. TaxID=217144 RepID=A0A6J4ICN2_9ACTN|nr:MAG: hypothetical protein AVDCRST_MAG57-1855 [uncultured Blastococcus sp.]